MSVLTRGCAGRAAVSAHCGLARTAGLTPAAMGVLGGVTGHHVAAFSSSTDDPMGSLLELRSTLGKKNVKYLLPSYVDMHGVSKSKVVPLSHMMNMMGGSEMFTGAALDGVPQDMSDPEVCSIPDASSCVVLPWQPDTAWFASDLNVLGAAEFEACSRRILGRVLTKAADMGFQADFGTEAEFFVLKDGGEGGAPFSPLVTNRPALAKPAYDVSRVMDNMNWLGELVDYMNELGWDVYSFDHEDGVGQFEVDFTFTDALSAADRLVLLRWMSHEVARKHGGFASWMPKPAGNMAGSGCHFNISLGSADGSTKNLFKIAAGDVDEHGLGLSPLGYSFVAGMQRHLPAITAVSAPTVNSYKRLIARGSDSGFTWAPIFQSWGGNNRSNTLRCNPGRVELRAADSACNPYLAFAMCVAAGLEGIEQNLQPPPPNEGNLFERMDGLTPAQCEAAGVGRLPTTLSEAVDAFEADPLSKQVFGELMYDSWREFKRAEWAEYHDYVSQWEMDRYLKMY